MKKDPKPGFKMSKNSPITQISADLDQPIEDRTVWIKPDCTVFPHGLSAWSIEPQILVEGASAALSPNKKSVANHEEFKELKEEKTEELKTKNIPLKVTCVCIRIRIRVVVSGARSDIGFSQYGIYWSQLCKICTVELLSAKRVESFSFIRKEGDNLVDKIRMVRGSPVNLTEMFLSLAYSTVSWAAFGKECTQQKKFLNAMKEAFKHLSGFSIVDFYPSLGFIGELMGLRAWLERVHQHLDEILEEIFEEHQAKNHRGDGIGEDIVDGLLRLANHGELDISLTTDNIKGVILYNIFIVGNGKYQFTYLMIN
ncbi:hypothetical protein IEQ34_012945 [Dendrobium chrysotoxum]|uniref:Cytochrome P450 n=1 Tax=Dendrobium chrysotoxum TaxID=161865 RepID=A0AAV7GN70_DENCH|nr:hypothetical protein IEQ34_012945 [Dendrobium chrysotoxum]